MTARASRVLSLLALALSLGTTAAAVDRPVFLKQLRLPVTSDLIGYPRAVAADLHTGELFVCDTRKNRLLIFDSDGLLSFQIPGGDVFSGPMDIAIDPEGYLLVAANHGRKRTLVELDFDGLFLREIPLSKLPGGSVEPVVTSVALSPDGARIYALDTANLRLWIADRAGHVSTSADLAPGLSEHERRDLILGKVDVYGDTVLVAVRSAGEIRLFDLDGSQRTRVGNKGTSPCRLGSPVAAALDESGQLVIVDQQRMVILLWSVKGNRCLDEAYGLGISPGFLYYPMDLALDRQGRIYVTQGFEGRVQMYEGLAAAPAPPSTAKAEPASAPPVVGIPAVEPPATDQASAEATEPVTEDRLAETRSVVEAAVSAWSRAWANRRIEDYLAAYAADFRPAAGGDRATWEAVRRERLSRPSWIEVEVSDLVVDLDGDSARARFVQAYRSDRFRDRVRKTLTLELEDDGWRIVMERVDATLPAE